MKLLAAGSELYPCSIPPTCTAAANCPAACSAVFNDWFNESASTGASIGCCTLHLRASKPNPRPHPSSFTAQAKVTGFAPCKRRLLYTQGQSKHFAKAQLKPLSLIRHNHSLQILHPVLRLQGTCSTNAF